MVQFVTGNSVPGIYLTVAASQTTQSLGINGGKAGDYLESIIVVPGTATPGLVTLFDGTTPILSIPAGTTIAPYRLELRLYSKTGAWNITTGTNVSCVAVGQFS